MFKAKVSEIVNSCEQAPDGSGSPFSRIIRSKLRVVSAFRFADTVEAVDKELVKYNKSRMELFEKHGELNADESQREITAENLEAFQAELAELLEVEVELPGRKLTLGDFESASAVAPIDIMALKWVVQRPEAPAEKEKAKAAAAGAEESKASEADILDDNAIDDPNVLET